MSFGKIKSFSISSLKDWEESFKTDLDLVESYLSIEEWTPRITFSEVLMGKLASATKVKQGLMKMHGITDVKDVTGFRCQVCNAVFPWPTALGGHMSKAHPNYKKKKMEKEMEEERAFYESLKKEELQYETTRIERDDEEGSQCEN